MSMDSRAFRNALGQFATGVTVVSIKDGDDVHGMTANSFTSVSLDPPLILICVHKDNTTHRLIEEKQAFAVSVLSENHEAVSRYYAGDRSIDLTARWSEEKTNSPVLSDALAWYDCRLWQAYDGGDHTIYVGEVLEFDAPGGRPLLFFGGRYGKIQS